MKIDLDLPADAALQRRQQMALAAYQEGLISLGKLAESLGLDPVSARRYLKEQGIAVTMPDIEEALADVGNA